MIKAIETEYAGCRFRSRLEARWAVFFDHAGIRWEYEPQGFDMCGRRYLPDFLLVDSGTWVEVKGSVEQLDYELMLHAATHLPEVKPTFESGPRLLLLGPMPAPLPTDTITNYTGSRDYDWGWLGFKYDPDCELGERLSSRWWGFGSYHKNLRPWLLVNTSNATPVETGDDDWLTPTLDPYESGLPDAYIAARSARFEFGERG